jgi:hypothetical protein
MKTCIAIAHEDQRVPPPSTTSNKSQESGVQSYCNEDDGVLCINLDGGLTAMLV